MEPIVLVLVAGAAGGLLKSLMESNGRVAMPRVETVKNATGNDVHYVHLGVVMNLLLGAGMAAVTATTPITALAAGMATAFAAEKAVEIGKAKTA